MAKGIGAYNAVIAAIKKQTGVSHKEAQQTYRAATVRLGHAPTPKDVKSKAVREEASAAGKKIAAAAYAKERQLYKELARVRLSAKERKALAERERLKITTTRPKLPAKGKAGEQGRLFKDRIPRETIGAEAPDEDDFGGREDESPDEA
jgi:hypothetical protein